MDFVYCDTDSHPNEIAELYSYTEQNEFQLNVKVNKYANEYDYLDETND